MKTSGEQSLFDDDALGINSRAADVKKPDPVTETGTDFEKDDVYEELKDIIGPEAAKRVVEHYVGSNVYYQKRIIIKWKHEKIMDEFKKGASYRELARKYGYAERYIRDITKERTK
jgi:Mor family transcriptional regulator